MSCKLEKMFDSNWLQRIYFPLKLLKYGDIRRKRSEKQNKPSVVATMAKPPDSHSQISRYGWTWPTDMRSVSFFEKFTSGSRISASRRDLLKLPIVSKYYCQSFCELDNTRHTDSEHTVITVKNKSGQSETWNGSFYRTWTKIATLSVAKCNGKLFQ